MTDGRSGEGVVTHRLRTAIGRLLSHPLPGRAIRTTRRDYLHQHGVKLSLAHPAITDRVRAQVFFRIYESAEIRFIRRYLRSDLHVVELGSSIGITSAHVLARLGPGRRLVCVEANGEVLPALNANLAAAPPGRVTVVHGAIDYGARDYVGLSAGETVSRRIASGHGGDAIVRTTTLSRLISEAGFDRFALVCDIEGAERGIIDFDEEALRRCEQLIIELHAPDSATQTVSPDGRSIAGMVVALERRHGFRVRDSRGRVFVFERPAACLR